ncbi:hypothetical protein BJ878DRAFT_502541 [Calycina marina]|uniref:Secreted protein n=1 Tax=Calycina marina TaxID=1763456 RepID=A0A9P8CFV2_9HELO|nr:hypothetical protein BJ878DRAFT_502541 [Calycina marina]
MRFCVSVAILLASLASFLLQTRIFTVPSGYRWRQVSCFTNQLSDISGTPEQSTPDGPPALTIACCKQPAFTISR